MNQQVTGSASRSVEVARARQLIAEACEPPHRVDALPEHANLRDLGIDSIRLMQLVIAIEEELSRTVFSLGEVGRAGTVGELLQLVEASAPTPIG
jgi:acyl carrier protein